MLERQISLNIMHRFIFYSRLVHDEDVTKTADQGGFNINILITGFIWATYLMFFYRRVRTEISGVCPNGKMSALGGKRKRNLQTLGSYMVQ